MPKYKIGPTSINDTHSHARAVIDIGSNSVRMVVYHAPVRVPLPLFNEKYYCALGKGLAQTGKLNPDGVGKAKAALARFMAIASRLGIDDIEVLATAAIRDADDGADFVASVEASCGLDITIISGKQEAAYAAKGIMASIHNPHGIVADLGGGSMELAAIDGANITNQSSFEMGVLRLVDESGGDRDVMEQIIDEHLSDIDWLSKVNAGMIYAVGGSFRTIAKTHMRQSKYPLSILHEYKLSVRTVEKIVKGLKKLTIKEIDGLPGVPGKRAPTLYPAAMILQHLMHHTGAEYVIFSVSGIREGLLYSELTDEQREQDPLIASAIDLASLSGRTGGYARELYDWMQPLFHDEDEEHARLRMALCLVSEQAWTIDPNHRSEWAYTRIMQSAIKGANHRERVMLAMALYHRYQNKWKQSRDEVTLLDERDRLWAKCVGNAANLAFNLSGGKYGNLHHARLDVDDKGGLRLELDDDANPLRTEMVEKKLDGLGSAFKALSSFVI